MTESKEVPVSAASAAQSAPAPKTRKKAPKLDHFIALRSGLIEIDGEKVSVEKHKPFSAPKGSCDHLFDDDGVSKVAERVTMS